MRLLYATSIRYPSPYANRIQTLSTAEALHKQLGDAFVLTGNHIDAPGLYAGRLVNFRTRFGPLLAILQLLLAKRGGFNTIYSREIGLLFYLMLGNQFFRFPLRYVYEAHGMDRSWRARYVLARVAHAFCLTTPLKEDLEALSPNLATSVLSDSVDVEKFVASESPVEARTRLGISPDAKVVLYVGELDQWKGVETLYQAAALLPEPVRVVIIGGRDWQIPELSKTHPRVSFLGPSPYEKLPDNMAVADVLVLPNTASGDLSARHTSPLKLFAYMTSGRPIVASDLPSLRDVLSEENAFLVEPDNPVQLAGVIHKVLGDSVEAGKRAATAREDVKRYTWEERAKRILATLAP